MSRSTSEQMPTAEELVRGEPLLGGENTLASITDTVCAIVEKPKPDEAPSTLAVVGRYLLSPTIFEKLATTGRGAGGEIQLTDAISDLLADEEIVAFRFEGKRYDCGSKLGYLEATVEYGLRHHRFGDEFAQYLRDLMSKN